MFTDKELVATLTVRVAGIAVRFSMVLHTMGQLTACRGPECVVSAGAAAMPLFEHGKFAFKVESTKETHWLVPSVPGKHSVHGN